jgi:hypothetical protein
LFKVFLCLKGFYLTNREDAKNAKEEGKKKGRNK